MTQPNHCARCGKWAGAHATLPGQPTDHLCLCVPATVEKAAPSALAQAADFQRACNLLPEGVSWGDALTPAIALHIASAQQAAQPVSHANPEPSEIASAGAGLQSHQAAQPLDSLALEALIAAGFVSREKADEARALMARHAGEQAAQPVTDMLRSLGFDGQCPESIGITLGRWRDGYAKWLGAAQPVAGEPVAPAEPVLDVRATWWSLVMGAAASLEDASACLRDPDAKRAADGAAKHYRERAEALYTAAPAPVGLVPLTEEWLSRHVLLAAHCAPASVVVLLSSIKRVIKAGKDGAK